MTAKKEKHVAAHRHLAGPRVMRRAEVLARLGMGQSQLDAAISRGLFPPSFPILIGGRARGWLASEVESFIASRAKTREEDA